jgi:hypothetical protein
MNPISQELCDKVKENLKRITIISCADYGDSSVTARALFHVIEAHYQQSITHSSEIDGMLYPERWSAAEVHPVALQKCIEEDMERDKGKKVIILTNSEVVFNVIRLAVVQGKIKWEDVRFIHVQSDCGVVMPVINKYGAIPDWPKNWFGEVAANLSEQILREARRMKKEERK